MVQITQTDYIDFLSKSGTSKSTKVNTIYNRPDYHPSFDFYKPIRDEIIDNLKNKKHRNEIYEFLDGMRQSKKFSRFDPLINGYLKFLGRKKIDWFNPPSAYWCYKELTIKMNPELGIIMDDHILIVKLYFKETPLENKDIEVLLKMMEQTLAIGIFQGYKCALLDVERGKLRIPSKKNLNISALIEGEAECFLKLWQSLEKKSA